MQSANPAAAPAPTSPGTVAVVIPCFNDGATLREAVDSARGQSRIDDLLVVDDGSTEPDTLAVFEQLEAEGVQVVHRENGGLGVARMTGVRATSCAYVFCLDADDRLLPGTLAALAARLDERPGVALVWGDYRLFGDRSRRQCTARTLDPWQISYQNDIPASVMARRSALIETGGWELRGGYEDWDMLMAMAERGLSGERVDVLAYEYRQHGPRMLGDSASRHGEIYATLRTRHQRLFDERRARVRTSSAPLLLRLTLPLVFALPIGADRRRLAAGALCHIANRRGWRVLLSRIRAG